MPRVLALLKRLSFINPTRHLLLEGICRLPDVVHCDPGQENAERTIRALERRHGRFDAILVDAGLFWRHANPGADRFPEDLLDRGLPIMVFHPGDDLHGYTSDLSYWFDFLDRTGAIVLSAATGRQFARKLQLQDYDLEPWLPAQPHALLHPEVIGDRYILFPHVIADDEFRAPDWQRKRHDVSVMGVRYNFRRRVAAHLAARPDYRVVTGADFIQRVLGRLINRSNLASRIYRRRFIDILAQSHVSVTCAGTVGYPIRKFFEIPAYGSLLAAQFFQVPETLGFVDGETCYHLEPDALDRLDALVAAARGGSEEIRRVTLAGQEMVRAHHHIDVRMRQFREIAEAVAAGRFGTVRWKCGAMQLTAA